MEYCVCGGRVFSDREVFSNHWTSYFMKIAKTVAEQSKDPSRKVGAVIVSGDKRIMSTGYNGFPINIKDDPEKYNDRPTKMLYVVHAEANAICQAAAHGTQVKGCAIFVTLTPCIDCAKLIIQSGITDVFMPNAEFQEQPKDESAKAEWQAVASKSLSMLAEAGLTLHWCAY